MNNYKILLNSLYNEKTSSILVEEDISFSKQDIENTDILDLKNVHFQGQIIKKVSDEIEIKGTLTGQMMLEDAISLEIVPYPFMIEISQSLDENTKIYENRLDLKELLWENIVLEIPLKFTRVEDLSKFHGDGWKLIEEDDFLKQENPFNELLKEFGEE